MFRRWMGMFADLGGMASILGLILQMD